MTRLIGLLVVLWAMGTVTWLLWNAVAITEAAKQRKRLKLIKKADRAALRGRIYLAEKYLLEAKELER